MHLLQLHTTNARKPSRAESKPSSSISAETQGENSESVRKLPTQNSLLRLCLICRLLIGRVEKKIRGFWCGCQRVVVRDRQGGIVFVCLVRWMRAFDLGVRFHLSKLYVFNKPLYSIPMLCTRQSIGYLFVFLKVRCVRDIFVFFKLSFDRPTKTKCR